jgi:hypothetical protein
MPRALRVAQLILAVSLLSPQRATAQSVKTPGDWEHEGWTLGSIAKPRPMPRTPGQPVKVFPGTIDVTPQSPPLLCLAGVNDAGGETLQVGTLYGPSCVYFLGGDIKYAARGSTALLFYDAAVEGNFRWEKPVTGQVPEGKGGVMKTRLINKGLLNVGIGRERFGVESNAYYYTACRIPHPTIQGAFHYGKMREAQPSCMYAIGNGTNNLSDLSKFEVLVYTAK